jgi:hypothetical protein
VLKSDCFLHAKHTTLLTILEQDQLCISSELDLFSACLRWAQNPIQKTESSLSIVETLGPALHLIRFRTMTQQEFQSTVVPSKILTDNDASIIFRCIETGTGDMPEGFSNNAKTRMSYGVNKMLTVNLNYSSNSCNSKQTSNWITTIICNSDTQCFGVQLLAARSEDSEIYNENVRVVIKEGGLQKGYGSFNGQVTKMRKFNVKFDKQVHIGADVQYSIEIIYSDNCMEYINYDANGIHKMSSKKGNCNIFGNSTHISGIYFDAEPYNDFPASLLLNEQQF